MSAAAKLGGDQLRKMNSEALAKQDYMAAVLTRFRLDLDDGEEKRVLLRSKMSLRPTDENARFIWATRGRTWGFRFLRSGGLEDPLRVYEDTFSKVGDQPEAWRRVADKVALRFPDPDGRQDAAGRVIPHDFVRFPSLADGINSLEDGRQRIWPRLPKNSPGFGSRAPAISCLAVDRRATSFDIAEVFCWA